MSTYFCFTLFHLFVYLNNILQVACSNCLLTKRFVQRHVFEFIANYVCRLPKKSDVSLEFCGSIYADDNCCLPVFDSEIFGLYDEMVSGGGICSKKATKSTISLHSWFCLACSPNQVIFKYYLI
jgi:hypothetical protein